MLLVPCMAICFIFAVSFNAAAYYHPEQLRTTRFSLKELTMI